MILPRRLDLILCRWCDLMVVLVEIEQRIRLRLTRGHVLQNSAVKKKPCTRATKILIMLCIPALFRRNMRTRKHT